MQSYTIGSWTVSSLYHDSLQDSKSLDLPDLSYSTDFSKSVDEPSEAKIDNVTSTELTSPEQIRYATSKVSNIYNDTSTPAVSKMPNAAGVQNLVEINEVYRAVNSATGQEVDLPCKGRIVLRFPNNSVVTQALIQDLLVRTISAAFATGSVDASREVQIARGIVVPSGL